MQAVPDPAPRGSVVGRSDRWGVLALLALVTVATLATQVASRVLAWVRAEAVRVPSFGPVEVPALTEAGVAHSDGSYDVHLSDPTTGQRLLDLVPGVLVTLLVAAGCWLVLALVRDLAAGDPFRGRASARLWLLATVLAIGLPVAWFTRSSIDLVLLTDLDLGAEGPGIVLELPWVPVLAGVVCGLVASAFRTGERLREDLEGLV